MIILIQSSGDPRSEFEVDQELQRAFSALHSARIRALGGGRFMDGSGYVVLAHDADGTAALAALIPKFACMRRKCSARAV